MVAFDDEEEGVPLGVAAAGVEAPPGVEEVGVPAVDVPAGELDPDPVEDEGVVATVEAGEEEVEEEGDAPPEGLGDARPVNAVATSEEDR
jgi:hypothetical protein